MLVMRRGEKTETVIELLQSYYKKLSKHIGELHKKQDIVMYFSGEDIALFNTVCGYAEPDNILEIASFLQKVQSYGKPLLWYMDDKNIKLQQYLLSHGFEKRSPYQCFYHSLTKKMPKYESHPAMNLVEVVTEEQFYEWCHIFSECQGITFEVVCAYFQSGYGEDRDYQLFIAQVYQKTIGCSALYIEDKQAILLWDMVLPMYRRQGVGSAMVLERMKNAKAQGCEDIYALGIYAQSSLLKGLGFKALNQLQVAYYDQNMDTDG